MMSPRADLHALLAGQAPSGPEMGWRSEMHGYRPCCPVWSASISCSLHWDYLQVAFLQRCLKNLEMAL